MKTATTASICRILRIRPGIEKMEFGISNWELGLICIYIGDGIRYCKFGLTSGYIE